MFEAEFAGKLPELRSREDYLTSCFFGALKYLPPNDGLFPLLNRSFNYRLGITLEKYLEIQGVELASFHEAQVHFWPRSSTYGEPDLVIIVQGTPGSFIIPVEVKYFSSKHGDKEEDQLTRYYKALGTVEGRKTFNIEAIREFTGDLLAFVYVTQFEAELEIEETLGVLESNGLSCAQDKFFHLRWQEMSKIIEAKLSKEHDAYRKAIYTDIRELMVFKNLLPFRQFSKLPSGLSAELLSQFPVFLYLQDPEGGPFFNGFPEIPKSLRLEYGTSIYYGGT